MKKLVKNRTNVCQDNFALNCLHFTTMNVYYKSNPYQKVDIYIIPNILIALLLRTVHIVYIYGFL